MEPTGIITNIQRFSLHDGPGIRTTVFFKGCPLRCQWCHNPETYLREQELCYKAEKCIGCGRCEETCELHGLALNEEGLTYQSDICRHCFECAESCPAKALFVCGERKSLSETLKEVLADKSLYISSHGGVTFSGGEATMQSEFVVALAKELKKEGIHLALDTCGFCGPEVFASVVGHMDLCLYDIKHSDSEKHKELTGVGNEVILRNLSYLNETGKPIYIRIPVIPGKNDSWENYEAIAAILSDKQAVQEVALLGYHALGLSKLYGFNGHQADLGIQPPGKDRLEEIKDFFTRRLPKLKVIAR